ncbi:MAG: 1-phosphofructokinase [Clostridiales bacterium]|nr:1-phosphofructokinase [Clostridiales bacterium]
MVYTVTFNPALDYAVGVEEFILGQVNRAYNESILPGGKGINVSVVLSHLSVENTALGFVAGFTGKQICERLESEGVATDFIEVEGVSRINIKLKSREETEINGLGPIICEEAIQELMAKLEVIEDGDFIVLAGSIPKSVPDSIYMDIMSKLKDRNIRFIVDATGDLLVNVLKNHPFLIKPNKQELSEIFNANIDSNDEVIFYARKLIDIGAENVLVSMAGDGAILVTKEDTFFMNAPKGELVDSVGAGDSMVAGFIAGYIETQNLLEALKMGIAAGSASAFSKNLATADEIRGIYQQIVL